MADWRRRVGRIVTDSEGAIGGVSVTVYKTGTAIKCTLKDNKAGTEALANPFETNAQGIWAFFINIETLSDYDYEVDIVFSKSGLGFSVMNEMYENYCILGVQAVSGLSDVVIENVSDSDRLVYDAATTKWKNQNKIDGGAFT